jgi:hypothetical protein
MNGRELECCGVDRFGLLEINRASNKFLCKTGVREIIDKDGKN